MSIGPYYSAGVAPRARIPPLTETSLDMLPAVIGILIAGTCYVPMDVIAWSRSRNDATLSELESPVALVTSRDKEPTLEELSTT
jgi:acyl-CoA synthetase (AMP-forming)/AMP-acid ligase II